MQSNSLTIKTIACTLLLLLSGCASQQPKKPLVLSDQNGDTNAAGMIVLKNANVRQPLVTYGATTIINSALYSPASITGNAILRKVTAHQPIIIIGSATLDKSTLYAPVTITGGFNINNCTLGDLILYTAGTQRLFHTTIQNIIVDHSSNERPFTLELIDSTIDGIATFHGPNQATIILKGNSAITGEILGATIKQSMQATTDLRIAQS